MSSFSIPAITAFVEATAGIIRLTTPVKTKHRALGFSGNSIETTFRQNNFKGWV